MRARYFLGGAATYISLMILFYMFSEHFFSSLKQADGGMRPFMLFLVLGNPGAYYYLIISIIFSLISIRLFFAKKGMSQKDRLSKSMFFAAGGLAVFVFVNLSLIGFLFYAFSHGI